jgi:hypothetical protein
MEKEPTQELFYEELLKDFVEPEEIENTFFIDPSTELPEDFPNISKYIKSLGTEIVDIREKMNEIKIIFEGGEVQYNKEYNITHANFAGFQISKMILYGVTAEPGIRALGTSKFDTHILFDIHNNKYLKYAKPDDLLYTLENGNIMRITIKEPEDANIKDWWMK